MSTPPCRETEHDDYHKGSAMRVTEAVVQERRVPFSLRRSASMPEVVLEEKVGRAQMVKNAVWFSFMPRNPFFLKIMPRITPAGETHPPQKVLHILTSHAHLCACFFLRQPLITSPSMSWWPFWTWTSAAFTVSRP
jgi:hypothetical protein